MDEQRAVHEVAARPTHACRTTGGTSCASTDLAVGGLSQDFRMLAGMKLQPTPMIIELGGGYSTGPWR